jgi:hypothetical protein
MEMKNVEKETGADEKIELNSFSFIVKKKTL